MSTAYKTVEHKVNSMRGWKRPLYTGHRTYRSADEIKRRIGWLNREYGRDNVVPMVSKDDPLTTVVYVRVA